MKASLGAMHTPPLHKKLVRAMVVVSEEEGLVFCDAKDWESTGKGFLF